MFHTDLMGEFKRVDCCFPCHGLCYHVNVHGTLQKDKTGDSHAFYLRGREGQYYFDANRIKSVELKPYLHLFLGLLFNARICPSGVEISPADLSMENLFNRYVQARPLALPSA